MNCQLEQSHLVLSLSFTSAFLCKARCGDAVGVMPRVGSEFPTMRGSAIKSSLRKVKKSRDEEPKKDL